MGLFKIVELPTHMRPASRFLNAATFVDLLEPRVTIRLQRSLELAQVRLRMFSLAIRCVGEPHRRWCLVSCRPVVASFGGFDPSRASEPAVVIMRSDVSMLSLMRTGMP